MARLQCNKNRTKSLRMNVSAQMRTVAFVGTVLLMFCLCDQALATVGQKIVNIQLKSNWAPTSLLAETRYFQRFCYLYCLISICKVNSWQWRVRTCFGNL